MASPPLSDNGLCRPDTEWLARTRLELTFTAAAVQEPKPSVPGHASNVA